MVRRGEGDRVPTALTVTETHWCCSAGLFGDFNPLHVDESHAKGSATADASWALASPVGLQHHRDRVRRTHLPLQGAGASLPGHAGGPAEACYRLLPKPKHAGGIVAMQCECLNQEGTVVAEADGKILVSSRPR